MPTDRTHRQSRCHEFFLILMALLPALIIAGCGPTDSAPSTGQKEQQLKEGINQVGPWRYEYSVTAKGTRSEGYHGKLFYGGQELAAPQQINDYYETPWGRLYWVGNRPVLFGGHGWMTSSLAREPVGQALADPETLTQKTFVIQAKMLTAEELGTPDRLESEQAVLDVLKPFGLQEAHVQRTWFQLGREWVTLHDTKRWGSLQLRLADPGQGVAPAVELRSTGDLTVEAGGQGNPFEALLSPPTTPGTPKIVPLPAQSGTLRVIKCTLAGIVSDSLEMFLVCRIEEPETN